jgi:hypothetical protein
MRAQKCKKWTTAASVICSVNQPVGFPCRTNTMEFQWVGSFPQDRINWHINCSNRVHCCKKSTVRDKMESTASHEFSDIQYEKDTFHAAVCHRCGAKMFPAELLESHMDRHELKDMYLQSELKKLQYAMNRMR